MVGYYTMRLPNADSVYRLIRKLDKQNDISLKEADWIYSLLSENPKVFNFDSSVYNHELYIAIERWYKTVSKKLKEGKRGNFIFTIMFNKQQYINKLTLPAWKAIKKYGNPEDLYNVVVIDEKIYSALPYKHMFDKIKHHKDLKGIYKIKNPRAGLYHYPIKVGHLTYTIDGLINQLAPIATIPLANSLDRALYREAFKVAVGAHNITQDPCVFDTKEVELLTLAAFIKHKDISCAATIDAYGKHFAAFVEKGRERVVKEAINVPFDEIAKNAVQENVINKETAKTLLNSEYIILFSIIDFINASVKYLDDVVKTKLEWKDARKIVEDEEGWLENIR